MSIIITLGPYSSKISQFCDKFTKKYDLLPLQSINIDTNKIQRKFHGNYVWTINIEDSLISNIIQQIISCFETFDVLPTTIGIILDVTEGLSASIQSKLIQSIKNYFSDLFVIVISVISPCCLHGIGALNSLFSIFYSLSFVDAITFIEFDSYKVLISSDSTNTSNPTANLDDILLAMASDIVTLFSNSILNELRLLELCSLIKNKVRIFDIRSSFWRLNMPIKRTGSVYNPMRSVATSIHSQFIASAIDNNQNSSTLNVNKSFLVGLTINTYNKLLKHTQLKIKMSEIMVALEWATTGIQWKNVKLYNPIVFEIKESKSIRPISSKSIRSNASVTSNITANTNDKSIKLTETIPERVIAVAIYDSWYNKLLISNIVDISHKLVENNAFLHKFLLAETTVEDINDAIDGIRSIMDIYN